MKKKFWGKALEMLNHILVVVVYSFFGLMGLVMSIYGIIIAFMDENAYARFIGNSAVRRYSTGYSHRERGNIINVILCKVDELMGQYAVSFLVLLVGVLVTYFIIRKFLHKEKDTRDYFRKAIRK